MLTPIQLTGHNVEITQTLRNFVTDKFGRITKHIERATSIHVILDIVKLRQIAKVKIHIPHSEIYAEAESEDMYKTIDLLIDKITRQMEKHKK